MNYEGSCWELNPQEGLNYIWPSGISNSTLLHRRVRIVENAAQPNGEGTPDGTVMRLVEDPRFGM